MTSVFDPNPLFVNFRRTYFWRGKRFVIKGRLKGKMTMEAGYFYCPYPTYL